MGCGGSSDTRETQKHLVVVGFSFAGFNLLHKVKDDFKVTIIDKKDFFEWSSGTPSSIHSDETFETSTVDYHKMINVDKVFGRNVKFQQALLDEIVDQNTITIKPTKGKTADSVAKAGSNQIKFDYLVLTTGHVYSINEDTETVFNMYSRYQKADLYAKYRQQIEEANSILVVGGGATGVEMVGEVLMKYGDQKKVAIATNADKLLTQYPADVGKFALEHFKAKDVDVLTKTKYEPNSSLAKEYDFVINCVGTRIHTPYMDASYKNFKDEKGRIFVNKYFQVTNVNPLTGKSSGSEQTLENIFCFGDACLTKMDEPKNIPSIFECSYIVANNLIQSKDGNNSGFQEMPKMPFFLSAVYFDDTNGAITIGSNVMQNPNMFKDKGGFKTPYFSFMTNDKDGSKNWEGYVNTVLGMTGKS